MADDKAGKRPSCLVAVTRVLKGCCAVPAGIFCDDCAPWMLGNIVGDVVHAAVDDNPAVLEFVVPSDFCNCEETRCVGGCAGPRRRWH